MYRIKTETILHVFGEKQSVRNYLPLWKLFNGVKFIGSDNAAETLLYHYTRHQGSFLLLRAASAYPLQTRNRRRAPTLPRYVKIIRTNVFRRTVAAPWFIRNRSLS